MWLHEHGVLWDEDTCRCAAANGKLEALQYFVSHGCDGDLDACLFYARHAGHEHVADWILREHGQ